MYPKLNVKLVKYDPRNLTLKGKLIERWKGEVGEKLSVYITYQNIFIIFFHTKYILSIERLRLSIEAFFHKNIFLIFFRAFLKTFNLRIYKYISGNMWRWLEEKGKEKFEFRVR